jgi:phosphomannomutase
MSSRTRFFGTAGARGFTNIEITPEVGLRLGLALATYYNHQGCLLIAHEGRFGAQSISDAIRSGLMAGGMNVLECGELLHPGFGCTIKEHSSQGGVYVTGSHMPAERIGIMVFMHDAAPAVGSTLLEIESIYFEDPNPVIWNKVGSIAPLAYNGVANYIQTVLKLETELIPIIAKENFQVVVDPGHGTMREALPRILHMAGVDTIILNSHPDPYFQGRSSDPSTENLMETAQYVKNVGADLAFATDSDGDRISLITETGEPLIGDIIGALFAEQALNSYGSGSIVTCVNASSLIEWVADRYDGEVIYNRIGPPDTVRHIKLHNPISAYEDVGKFYWPRKIGNFWGDSGLAALELLGMLAMGHYSLSRAIRHFPKFHTIKTGVELSDTVKYTVFEKVVQTIDQIAEPNARILTIDGIRIFFADGWLLIRPSGTEPVIRVYAESRNPNRASVLAQQGVDYILEVKHNMTNNI